MAFKINFSGRSHEYTDEEVNVVVEAMRNADPLTQGRYRNEFEKTFSRNIGAEYAFTVCNATAALEMAAQLCRFQPGDEIIIPSHTFTSSAYPFAKNGASIVWADIDIKSRVVTAESIFEKITSRTKAVVVVHLYGFMADMPAIMEVAKRNGLLVIEDAAQSIGTEIDGKKSGTFGDFGVFSFHSHKNITTLGEGGMLAVKEKKIADLIPLLRHNGHCDFDFEREAYWIPAMGNVDFPTFKANIFWPNNFCLGEVECALGIKMLERLDHINQEKRRRALGFIDALQEFTDLEFHREDSNRHNFHLLTAMVRNGKRDSFIAGMSREKGIQCVVQYCPLNRYPLYQKAGFGTSHCPNAEKFFDNMVSFPFQYRLSENELAYMLDSTKEILSGI